MPARRQIIRTPELRSPGAPCPLEQPCNFYTCTMTARQHRPRAGGLPGRPPAGTAAASFAAGKYAHRLV